MKKILIVDANLELPPNKRVIIKKNKTIIKDFNIYDDPSFIQNLEMNNTPYNFYIEDWEVMDDNRIQIICGNDGSPLRPVHIISDVVPKNGVKALFQSERMVIMKIQNEMFEITKNFIEDGKIVNNVIYTGEFEYLTDMYKTVSENFHPMIDALVKNYEKYRENGYLSPIWSVL